MRIACLQFAPQVGDVDNNLHRADAVLSKANPDDLDLLLLPELAFTGYNFKSLQDISPFLEPSGSGISSLWARTTALKYNCVVGVGYPEKVDVSKKWPTSPEYYNSLIIVNGEGETVANYRKSFLYYTDETWALEGPDGFYEGHIPGLGHCSIGICMDLNPYKFEAPWHAFEFALHVLEMESNLVIVSMAWVTREDPRRFSRMPKEPDMDTLTYWVTRLEPIIRADNEEEIVFVFCNRTGIEDDAVYAGTSAVLGIKDGEVSVYGLLGRGEKELLVVDTDNPPSAKLVYRPDGDSAVSSQVEEKGEIPAPPSPPSAGPSTASGQPLESLAPKAPNSMDSVYEEPGSRQGVPKEVSKAKPSINTSAEPSDSVVRRNKPQSPKLQIPYSPTLAEVAAKLKEDAENMQPSIESAGVPTPTGPSPTPLTLRPQFGEPEPAPRKGKPHVLTLHPNAMPSNDTRIFGGHVLISHDLFTPITPFEDETPVSPRYFWMPPDSLLKSPTGRRDWTPALPESPTVNFKSRFSTTDAQHRIRSAVQRDHAIANIDSAISPSNSPKPQPLVNSIDSQISKVTPESTGRDKQPDRPASPKSRNASRTGRPERSESSLSQHPDFPVLIQRLESLSFRTGSAAGQQQGAGSTDDTQPERPSSPKSRNASRSRPWLTADDLIAEQRQSNLSRNTIMIGASPSVMDSSDGPQGIRGLPERIENASSPVPRLFQHGRSFSGTILQTDRPGSRQGTPVEGGNLSDRPQSRTTQRNQISNISEPITNGIPPRTVSRGRQPGSDSPIINGKQIVPPARSQSRRGMYREDLQRGRSREHRSASNHALQIGSVEHDATMSPNLQRLRQHGNPDGNTDVDEIVEMEMVRPSPNCPIHGHRRPSAARQASSNELETASSQPGPSSKLTCEISGEAQDPSPALCGSSIKSIITPKDSPATPPFEPRTPQAMMLIRDDDDTIPLTALTEPTFKIIKSLNPELEAERPKSAVW
ncbi:hypothetical protein BX600DRAFT_512245 [Xylariales sp. PMI_506]|nr:hypothetical protein BX600DRAFT_512245 [Xylariales sp. PMI_506]